METNVFFNNIDRLLRQRNLFLLLTLVLAACLLLISIRLVTFDQKIILVPGISREMTISNSGVSNGYLEETALLFLSHLLDISAEDIAHKRELVLKYTSYADPLYSKAITEYFANSAEQYSKFNLATHFTIKNLQIDQNKLEVIANGILTSSYGKTGHQTKEVSYRINFDYQGGFLRLKEFGQIITEEEKKQ